MSKDLFLQMRQNEIFDATFTKKMAQNKGREMVQNVLDNGNITIHDFTANIVRLKAVIDTAEAEIRNHLTGLKQTINGVTYNPMSASETINYKDCPIWQQLKNDLSDRESLLKLAQKQDVFDAYGNEVPKVSTTTKKSSYTITF